MISFPRLAISILICVVLCGNASASLLGYQFTDTLGVVKEVAATSAALNPTDEFIVHVSSGLERVVRIQVFSSSEVSVYDSTSTVVSSSDSRAFASQNYYGKTFTIPSLAEGVYSLKVTTLDGQNVISTENFNIIIDKTPPSYGEMVGDLYNPVGAGPNGEIIDNQTMFSDYRSNGIYVYNVEDAISGLDVAKCKFKSIWGHSDLSGQVYAQQTLTYDPASKAMKVGGASGLAINLSHMPASDGVMRIDFELVDLSGNRAVVSRNVKWNNASVRRTPVLLAVHNPNYQGTNYGQVGFEPYTPGMTVYENPIKLIYGIKKGELYPSNPYGILFSNNPQEIGSDANYDKLVLITVAHQSNKLAKPYSHYEPTSNPLTLVYDVVLADPSLSSPQVVKRSMVVGGIEYPEFTIFKEPILVDSFKVEVEPRNYSQRLYMPWGNVPIAPGSQFGYYSGSFPHGEFGKMKDYTLSLVVSDESGALKSIGGINFVVDNNKMQYEDFEYLGDELRVYLVDPDAAVLFGGKTVVGPAASATITLSNATGSVDVESSSMLSDGKNAAYNFNVSGYSGVFNINGKFKDNAGNELVTLIAQGFVVDNAAPNILVKKGGSLVDGVVEVEKISDLSFELVDNLNQSPALSSVVLRGGPAQVEMAISTIKNGNQYGLEAPVLFPTSVGQTYQLEISTSDNYNNATRVVEFTLKPRSAGLVQEGIIKVPALDYYFKSKDGRHAFSTKPLTRQDGSLYAGSYDLFAAVRQDSDVGAVINGTSINPGETKLVAINYSLSGTGGVIDLPFKAFPTCEGGKAFVLLYSGAPDFPTIQGEFDFWKPLGTLSVNPYSPRQYVDEITVEPKEQGVVVADTLAMAKSASIFSTPTVVVDWKAHPQYMKAKSNSPIITGPVYQIGNSQFDFELSAVDPHSGDKISFGQFSQGVTVAPLAGIEFALNLPGVAAQSVQDIKITATGSGSFECSPSVSQADVISASASSGNKSGLCFWEWTSLPQGMAQAPAENGPYLHGSIDQLGDASFAYRVSVFDPSGTKIVAQEGQGTLKIIPPTSPKVSFETNHQEISPDVFRIPNEEGVVGFARVSVPSGVGDLTLEVEGDSKGSSSYQLFSSSGYKTPDNNTNYSIFVKVPRLPIFQSKQIKLTAYYNKLATMKATKSVDVVAFPSSRASLVLSLPSKVLSTDEVSVDLAIGMRRNGELAYDQDELGLWEAQLGTLTKDGWVPITEKFDLVDGRASVPIGLTSAGATKFLAKAWLKSPYPEFSLEEVSNTYYLTTLLGEAPEGEVVTRRLSGRAPLIATFSLRMDNSSYNVLGDVVWQISSDEGATWQDLEQQKVKTRLGHTFPTGVYKVRAKLTNRLTDEQGYSQELEILSYEVPQLNVSGGSRTVVNHPLRLAASLEGSSIENPIIQWEIGGQVVHTGAEFEVPAEAPGFTRLIVKAKSPEAPDEVMAWDTVRYYVQVNNMVAPVGRLKFPRYLEVGNSYTFDGTGFKIPLFGIDTSKFNVMGLWTFPGGVTKEGVSVEYIPTDADGESKVMDVSFKTWVAGYENQFREVRAKVRVGRYDWPEFKIDTYPVNSTMLAPAYVIMTCSPENYSGRLESPVYTWSVPASADLRNSNGPRVTAVFNKPGSHEVAVHIADQRESEAVSLTSVTIDPAPAFDLSLSVAESNKALREPLNLNVYPRVSGGHPNDRPKVYRYTLDGEPLDSSAHLYLRNVMAGDHVLRLEMESQFGATADVEHNFSVADNQLPSCEVQKQIVMRSNKNYYHLVGTCTDQDGRVVNISWFNGQTKMSSIGSIIVPAPDSSQVLHLVATDDSNESSSKSVQIDPVVP